MVLTSTIIPFFLKHELTYHHFLPSKTPVVSGLHPRELQGLGDWEPRERVATYGSGDRHLYVYGFGQARRGREGQRRRVC